MDGFTYQNIFDTKGVEYIIVIAFLLTLIPFWLLLNRRVRSGRVVQNVPDVSRADSLNFPKGLFFSPNHIWAHLEKSGNAIVGIDHLLSQIVKEVEFSLLRQKGDRIQKGDLLSEIHQDGKSLKIYSPVSGEITGINPLLSGNAELINQDPYSGGWIYKIKPSQWKADTNYYYLAEEAANWSNQELQRFKDFLSTAVEKFNSKADQLVLQDGGELRENPLPDLPGQIWVDFQKEFLDLK